jgi:plastocyanin
MVVRRRRQRGLGPVVVGGSALLLVACGASSAISADVTSPTPDIQPNACSILSDADIVAAFTPVVTPGAPAPTQSGPITHVYSVVSINEGGTKTAGQCTWSDPSGAQVITLVFPQADITKMAEYATGTQVGGAFIQEGDGRGFVAVPHAPGVIAITLVLDIDPGVRTVRLADLARTASGAAIPKITAAPATASASASASGPVAAAPGQKVTGQTANQTVKQTDGLKFNPNATALTVGQVVEWDNSGSIAHNVTCDESSAITSDTMNGGDKYQVKFTKAGSYPYHCTFHPGMDGTITVK